MRRPILAALSLAIALAATVAALAEPPKGNAQDEKAIRKIAAAYKKALKEGSAQEIAALWAPGGDFVNALGQYVQGRAAIENEFATFFAESGGVDVKTTPISLRFITPEVAIGDGMAEPVPTPPGPPIRERYTVVYHKQDGKWMVESVRETVTLPPSNYDHLAALEWMIGRWAYRAADADGRAFYTSCRWDMNKNFIVREFSARVADGATLSGVQRIGWDPVKKAVRSWVFESSGAYLEGQWTQEGDRWIIKVSGALPDGRQVSATDVVTKINDNAFTFQATDRRSDGQSLPDSDKIELKRVEQAD